MKPHSMWIVKRTAYTADRPEGQADLGLGQSVTACAEDIYDFKQDTHRKDMLTIMFKTLLATYSSESAANILQNDLNTVTAKLSPSSDAANEITWPTA